MDIESININYVNSNKISNQFELKKSKTIYNKGKNFDATKLLIES